jgi:hypothetical protein
MLYLEGIFATAWSITLNNVQIIELKEVPKSNPHLSL